MRCFLMVIGLWGWWASSLPAQDVRPGDYCRVELRGTLRFDAEQQEMLHIQAIHFNSRAGGHNLIFGDNKELKEVAKKLDGKTVLIHGHIGVWSPLSAVAPTKFTPYIQVAAIKAADEPAQAGEPAEADAAKEAAELLKGLTVTGKLTQAIGVFSSEGGPAVGDSFELAFDKLPQEMLKFATPDAKHGTHYVPFAGPLRVEQVKQGKGVSSPGRTAIHLFASDATSKLLIQVIAESLEKGSKVRIYLFRDGGFLGSMAEGEGVLK